MSMSRDALPASGQDLAQVLSGLLRLKSMALLEERQRGRLHGLLRDYAPGSIRDIRILLLALESGAVGRIGSQTPLPAAEALAPEADGMVERFGCDRTLALAAITTWARALADLRGESVAALSPARPRSTPAPLADDGPGWLARFGGLGFALFLVLVALAHWFGAF